MGRILAGRLFSSLLHIRMLRCRKEVPAPGIVGDRRGASRLLLHRRKWSPHFTLPRKISADGVWHSVFQPRVSFDTFGQAEDFIEENSFTLVTKHKDYEYTKRSRTFLCGCDDNDYSEYALQWLIDELVDDGDEIVCLRVVEKDDNIAGERSVEKGRYRSEAEDVMKLIQDKNHENKAVNLVLEFAVGKVNKVIDEMVSRKIILHAATIPNLKTD
jgi:hypothetical protein